MKEFILSIRVYYEDTDAGGVVYYANYLKFMERARTEYLRGLGFDQRKLSEEEDVVFAVSRAEIDYLSPARLDDTLQVKLRVAERRRASFLFEQEIIDSRDGRLLCRGRLKIACLEGSRFRPRPIPKSLLEKLPHDD